MIIDWSERRLYNEKYIPLLKDQKRYIFLVGGGGSGKSVFQSQKEIIKSYEKGNRCLCVRKVKDTLKQSMFQELKTRIEGYGLQDHFHITESPMYIKNKITGSDFIFRGLDDVEKIKSVARVTRVWIEEGSEVSKKDFDQIDLRLRGEGNLQITTTTNPIDEDLWINRDFWEKGETEDVTLCHSTFLDNRWVGEEYKNVMERLKKENPAYYNIYALGLWGSKLEGLVFPKYETVEAIPLSAKFIAYGLDFGYENDPTALVGVWEIEGNRFYQEFLCEKKLIFSDIADKLDRLGIDKRDEIFADSNRPEGIEELHRRGYNVKPCIKGADSIDHGISIIKEKNIMVVDTSLNLLKELRNYVWIADKNGTLLNKPVDDFNHCFVGETLVTTSSGDKFIKDIKRGDKVLTSKGYKKVLRRWDNGLKQTYSYRLQFDTHMIELICTPNHKIKTYSGWKEISQLQSGEMVYLHRSLKEELTTYIQGKGISPREEEGCTQMCGSLKMGIFQKITRSTIRTITHGIIGLRTLSVLKDPSTFRDTLSCSMKRIQTLLGRISKRLKVNAEIGTRARKEKFGTGSMEREVGRRGSTKRRHVNTVERSIVRDTQGFQSSVTSTAKLLHIERGCEKRQEVYDLFVEDCHEYYANGILVHNCIDAARYAIVSKIKRQSGFRSNVKDFI